MKRKMTDTEARELLIGIEAELTELRAIIQRVVEEQGPYQWMTHYRMCRSCNRTGKVLAEDDHKPGCLWIAAVAALKGVEK